MNPLLRLGWSTLDVGTGEMMTFADVAARAFTDVGDICSCDISFSRIKVGRQFIAKTMPIKQTARLHSFVGNLFKLPLRDDSVDLIWTSHALEPNGGKEEAALCELFRIPGRYVVLFEPPYEQNTDEGRSRMERLGYIRGSPEAIVRAGGELVDIIKVTSASNPLNPTYAYICTTGSATRFRDDPWACPETHLPMDRRVDHFFSQASPLS